MTITNESVLQAIRDMPCAFCEAPPPSDPHHCPAKGISGGSRLDTMLTLLPVCRSCHGECESGVYGRFTVRDRIAAREHTYPDAIESAVRFIFRLDKHASPERIKLLADELWPESRRLVLTTLERAGKL